MILTVIEILSALGALGLYFGFGGAGAWSWLWMIPVYFLGFFLLGLLVLFLIVVVWCSTIDTNKPVEQERRFDRLLVEQYCGCLIRLFHIKLDVVGLEKMPREGRFLLVCNHIHLIDPGFLLWAFRGKQLAFIAKKEAGNMPFVNKGLHAVQGQRIDRENDREALVTILKCIDLIKQDKASVAVFPEGYTSMDGVLHEFRNGVFKIAQRTKVPIVVCTLKGSSRVFRDIAHFRRPHVRLELVKVVDSAIFTGTKDMGDHVHALMAENIGDNVG